MGLRTIVDHVMDIVQNSFKAQARRIVLKIVQTKDRFCFTVEDDGVGMSEEELEKVFDPFYTTRDPKIRRVGLGLPFLKQAAEATGGYVELESRKGEGTKVVACFNTTHVDCQEIGDVVGCLVTLLTGTSEGVELCVERCYENECYSVSTSQLIEIFSDLSSPVVIKALYELIEQTEKSLFEGEVSR
ncbi:ATP-binding protein [Pseudothermotoga sp.]|nr:ATP-binding protein [Pseudothermotoga sp.]MCX7813084.1 ATP-binding protein [Pseudothermotoga sp.]MDW8140486.1 ATP-binding protein [Pseudothermotoga sp.]